MPTYKLTYFDARGRAEPTRLMLAYSKTKYDDRRVTEGDWEKVKPTTPMGQLPVLEIDGKQICQTRAINKYLARKMDLNGSTDMDEAEIDMYAGGVDDFWPLLMPFFAKRKDMDEAKKTLCEINETKLQTMLPCWTKFIEKTGTGYLVGKKPTYADFMLFAMLDNFVQWNNSILTPHPKLVNYHKTIGNLPGVKEYLASRPTTPF